MSRKLALLVVVLVVGCMLLGACGKKKSAPPFGPPAGAIVADEDAWIDEFFADDNYGDDIDLSAGYCDGDEGNIFLYFDLSSIPVTATVTSAELRVYVSETRNTLGANFIFSLDEVDDVWDEDTITWNNSPTTTPRGTFAGPANGYVGWWKISGSALTALVQDWVSDSLVNDGIAILPDWDGIDAPDDEIYIDSLETPSGNPPRLAVTWTP